MIYLKLLYKVSSNTRSWREKLKFNIEKILFFCFIITFVLMIFVQAAITNPSIRASLSINDELEGTPLAMEEFLYNRGNIVLKLANLDKDENAKILVNGEETSSFIKNTVDVKVKNGDVIEIDASRTGNKIEVIALSKSGNIVTDCVNKRVKVDSNIKKMIKVKIR